MTIDKQTKSPERRTSLATFGEAQLDRPGHGEDTILTMPELSLFAIFDGAGGVTGGSAASSMAAQGVKGYFSSTPLGKDCDYSNALMESMENARAIMHRGTCLGIDVGVTTASVGILVGEEGENKKLYFANIGDSRIIIVRRDGKIKQLTEDECRNGSNLLTNCLSANQLFLRPQNIGEITIEDGDRIIFMSDGVTGDMVYGSDEDAINGKNGNDCYVMSNEQIAYAIEGKSDEEAANNLIKVAKKLDDRSVIIVTVGGYKVSTVWDDLTDDAKDANTSWLKGLEPKSVHPGIIKGLQNTWRYGTKIEKATICGATAVITLAAIYLGITRPFASMAMSEEPESQTQPQLSARETLEREQLMGASHRVSSPYDADDGYITFQMPNGDIVSCTAIREDVINSVTVEKGNSLLGVTGDKVVEDPTTAWTIAYNGLENPDFIYPGQDITVPMRCS